MDNKITRINTAIAYLKGVGKISYQKDIVAAMKADKTTVSLALRGDERYLTDSFLARFSETYTEINVDWLLTGKGKMLNNQSNEDFSQSNYRLIPLYSQDVVGGTNNQECDSNGYITGYLPFVNAKEEDISVPVTNNSMYPTYPAGTMVQIRKLEYWREYIELGQVYIIELKDDRRLIKEVRKGSDNKHFKLVSHNKDYDETEISKEFIRSIWLVLAKYQKVVM